MRTRKCLIVFAVIILMGAGCATNESFVKTGYQILSVGQQSYDVAMKSLVGLHAQGVISDEVFIEGFDIAEKYYKTHNIAVEALARYKENGGVVNLETFEENLVMSSSLLGDLLNIVKTRGEVEWGGTILF